MESKCVGRAFVVSQTAILRCARAQCRGERAEGARDRRSHLLRDESPKTFAGQPLRCGIARRSSQPRNWRYCFFFLMFAGEVSAFPSASRHYGIAAGTDRIAHLGWMLCSRSFIAEYVKEER